MSPEREERVRASFDAQADACRKLGSPFTARLCTLFAQRLDRSTRVGSAALDWQNDPSAAGDALALRLAGGLHALVLEGRSEALAAIYPPLGSVEDATLWNAVAEALAAHDDFLCRWIESAPQTNEVRRSAALLPGFLTIARLTALPLVLSEIGASAGLNLLWDRYRYRLGERAWGSADAPVILAPDWQGPDLAIVPAAVAERAGCDLNPLDPTRSEHRLRVLSYIWADQTERLARTTEALRIAAGVPAAIVKADATDWLESRLRKRWPGHVHVVYHSIMWQYLSAAKRARGEALIAAAGAAATVEAPLAWLRLEHDGKSPGAALTLTLWPAGEEHSIARADFHGRWIAWKGLS